MTDCGHQLRLVRPEAMYLESAFKGYIITGPHAIFALARPLLSLMFA